MLPAILLICLCFIFMGARCYEQTLPLQGTIYIFLYLLIDLNLRHYMIKLSTNIYGVRTFNLLLHSNRFGFIFVAKVYIPFEYLSSDSTVEGGSVLGEASGDVSIVPGIIGNALYVSGSSATNVLLGEQRDSCFWSPALCTNGYTMALWMKIGMKTGTELYYISNGGQASASYGVSINLASGPSLRLRVKTHDSWWSVNCPITKNEWHHVSFAWKSDTGIKAFLNGDECNDDTTAASNTRETSSFNGFYMGKPNTAVTQKGGEATYDELLFWPEYKDENFISALYDMYQQSTGKLSVRLLKVQNLEKITLKHF